MATLTWQDVMGNWSQFEQSLLVLEGINPSGSLVFAPGQMAAAQNKAVASVAQGSAPGFSWSDLGHELLLAVIGIALVIIGAVRLTGG